MKAGELTVIQLARREALAPCVEPLAVGVPFACGVLKDGSTVTALNNAGQPLPTQVTALARWSDGSVRWALVELMLEATHEHTQEILLAAGISDRNHSVTIRHSSEGDVHRIDTGKALIRVSRDPWDGFSVLQHATRDEAVLNVSLEEERGRVLAPMVESLTFEEPGPFRSTLVARGAFAAQSEPPLCRFVARLALFAGTGLARIELTLHNPRRARHRGGTWDLGDAGSITFRDLSISTRLAEAHQVSVRLAPSAAELDAASGKTHLYQASSGGEQWASRNHVDRFGRVALPFRGCRMTDGDVVRTMDRPSPTLSLRGGRSKLSIASPGFWQQFPKVLEGNPTRLRVGLFPREAAPHELQGGEQKTHTVWLSFGSKDEADVAWVHDPLVPRLDPAYVESTGAVPHFTPATTDEPRYRQLLGEALDGSRSFFVKREAIDEYGWRNFGDVWGDHEDANFDGEHPVISHYNNQYDLLYGFLLHFLRSGDRRWFELARDLARHVIDIDLYHTTEDKPAYSGGPFWHTAHYEDAGRATHRSYSKDSPKAKRGETYGGGPSCEHVYTTGLLLFHHLTGDAGAAEAVVQLADWLERADDGSSSLLGYIDPGPTGLASYTRTFQYHGPGRGAGNAINACLDAYHLTGSPHYLQRAEALIARCVHPDDDPGRHGLDDAENRWSYTVFLQVLGKYLDLKNDRGVFDRPFAYARASLLRYAEWMAAHEAPFATRFDQVEYPTETWPAQDMRKSCVFDYAARYGPAERSAEMTAAAERFYDASLDGVMSFATRACARPLAILLTAGAQRPSFRLQSPLVLPPFDGSLDFGPRVVFLPQRERVRAQLKTWAGWRRLARAALRPSLWRRVAAGRIW